MTDERLSSAKSKRGKLQRACLAVLREHEADGALPTSRQFVWYELISRAEVDKSKARGHPGVTGRGVDQDVIDAIKWLRDEEVIPWSWIVDETRTVYSYSTHTHSGILVSVRIDPWDGNAPLIITESRSLAGVLSDDAARYRCDISATNGQAGGFLHTEIAPLLHDGRRVLYAGDLDLSGGQIEANTRRVLEGYAALEWERVMLTEAQVDDYDLHDRKVLKHDRRYNDGHAHWAVETEALGQRRVVAMVRERLDSLLPEPLTDVRVRENAERTRLEERLATFGLNEDGES